MRYWHRYLVAMLLVSVIVIAGSSSGKRMEGDDVLVAGEHLAFPIELEKGEYLEIRIFVAVTDGPKIDVFWMTEDAYEDYQFDQNFSHYVKYTTIGEREVDNTFNWDGEGTFFVVIDNTASQTVPPADPEFSNATLRYVITWGPADEPQFRNYVVYTIAAAMAIFVGYLVFRFKTRRR